MNTIITVDEYYRMAEVGLLRPDARVELIEGEIVDMAPKGSRHAAVVNILARKLVLALNQRVQVGIQCPVRLDAYTEPQPDLMLLHRRSGNYLDAHPTADDVLLLIEVSDSTLRFDREVKVPLYALHGIPELWIVDLVSKQLHRMREPAGSTYKSSASIAASGSVSPIFFGDVQIDLASSFA